MDASAMSAYSPRVVGAPNSTEHRIYFEHNGSPISPFHDIPLFANSQKNIFNMVVEIPRWSNAKLEIATSDSFNPIKQDTKDGKLRFVRNCFPHKGYVTNYGCLPQTWEDPMTVHAETKAKGDNDPIDVCEIGEKVGYPGQVKQVKILGVMALLDEGETDWKIIALDVEDPLASKLNDIEDVERHLPGYLRLINEWFRIYKIPDGKPENQFAFSGETKNKKYATEVIHDCHEAWQRLITGAVPRKNERYNLAVDNVCVEDSPYKLDAADGLVKAVPAADPKPALPIDSSIDKWFFISGSSSP